MLRAIKILPGATFRVFDRGAKEFPTQPQAFGTIVQLNGKEPL